MVIIDNSDTQMEERRHRCLQAAERFFALPCAAKRKHAASDGPGCQVGYMVIEELGAEMFEAKRHHDPRWPWPDEQTRDDIVGYRENLHAIARTCLRALAQPTCALGLRPGYLESLLDQDRSDGTSTDLTTCSNTTMRIWRYLPDGVGNEVHCDNTLLTVAPPGTCIGLGARRVEDGRWLWPEQLMKPGQVLVFVGDALGFLTRGSLPALVHYVASPRAGAAARCSTPFFLRPRLDALLDARLACSYDEETAAQRPPEPPVSQRDLESNRGARGQSSFRHRWPWKAANAYYGGLGSPVRLNYIYISML